MKILRFDSLGGASGDMVLAALAGLGADMADIAERIARLPVESFSIDAEAFLDHGFNGHRVTVRLDAPEHHPHRRLADIRELIRGGDASEGDPALPERAMELSLRVFERLAEAEGRVHGVSPDEVHFHEVGAMDSIVDIVGASLALVLLDIDAVTVGPVPVGRGSTKGSHGVMPLPVPAVAELLKGHPLRQTAEPHELVTPTGAALLMTWQAALPSPQADSAHIVRVANAFGHRPLDGRPNLLRAMLLETEATATAEETCAVLECNIDDTVPELLGSLTESLLTKGALDVFSSSVQMKKQRPGTLLTVLCRPQDKDAMLDTIFGESTTFGIREYAVRRTVLDRRTEEVVTPYGKVRVKIGTRNGLDITRAPEHADCVKRASEAGVPIRTVYEAALKAALP